MATNLTPGEMDALDRATSDRLARLRDVPVDTSRLEARLNAAIPPTATPSLRWRRPTWAVAAGLLLSAGLTLFWLNSAAEPVVASPAVMAQMHHDLITDAGDVVQVDSIQAASDALTRQSSHVPELPSVPDSHVMACCMKSVENRKVACVLLKNEGKHVTMVVAPGDVMPMPDARVVNRAGRSFHLQASGRLNMVMTRQNDQWVCLMSEISSERLIELASALQTDSD